MSLSARALFASVVCLLSSHAAMSETLFVQPLHLTREIDEPFNVRTVRIDEYCTGDRVVSIRGGRVSIADYAKGELIEIDHERGTYSITSFEQLAASNGARTGSGAARVAPESWTRQRMAARGVAGRTAEVIEVRRSSQFQSDRLELALDPSISLTRDALAVLIGASYPAPRTAEHDAIMEASRKSDSAASRAVERYALPLEQISEHSVDGEQVRTSSRIIHIDGELPPPQLLQLPATRVESRVVERQRLLEEVDQLPAVKK